MFAKWQRASLLLWIVGCCVFVSYVSINSSRSEIEERDSPNLKLKSLAEKLSKVSSSLERLWCETRRVGGNGAFCLSKEKIVSGGNHVWDVELCKALEKLFGPGASVADFGAGLGHYGKCFLRKTEDVFHLQSNLIHSSYLSQMDDHINTAPIIGEWTGYDGAINVEELSGGFIKLLDLSEPAWLGRRWDWVVSIEVGEHIPAQFEDIFINNLIRHACKGIVLTWALPNQGGYHHVNERSNKYIKKKIEKLYLVNDLKAEAKIRNATELGYIQDGLMVFRFQPEKNCK